MVWNNHATTKYVQVLGVAWRTIPCLMRRHINNGMICETAKVHRVLRDIAPLNLGTGCIDNTSAGALGNSAIRTFNLSVQVRHVAAIVLESQAFFIADVFAKGGGLVRTTVLVNTDARQETLLSAQVGEESAENMKRGLLTCCAEET
jgi:hypothetical protein